MLFKFLQRNRTWFVYQPKDVLDKSVQVAQGVENTVEALTGNLSLLTELEERINTQIAEIGHVQAAQQMQQWVEQNQPHTDELFAPIVRAVRSYAEQLM